MRLIKAIVAMLIGVAILLGVALLVLPTQRIAALAAQQFEAATGRSLQFGGDVRASFYPVIGARAQNVRIGNPQWAGDTPMLAAAEMDIGLNLFALFRGDIVVERIILQDPQLHILRDAEGQLNWAFGRPSTTTAAPDTSEGASERRQRNVSLTEARIIGGNLHVEDAQSGTDMHITGLDATLHLAGLSGPADISASGSLNGQSFQVTATTDNAERLISGAVSAVSVDATVAGATLAFSGRAGLQDLVLEGQLQTQVPALRPVMQLAGQTGGSEAPQFLPLEMTGQVTRTADGMMYGRDLQLRAGGVRLTGAADLGFGAERPHLSGQFSGDVLDLRSAAATGQGGQGGQTGGTGWSRTAIDASALAALDTDISLTLAGLRTDATTLGRLRVGVAIDRARAVFDLREVALFGGQMTGEFVMNNRSGLSVGGDLRLRAIDLLPLLTEMADYRRLQGMANMDLQFLGVGNNLHDIMNSLRGEGTLALSQGEIIGFDLAGMLRNLDMSYMGEGNRTVYQSVNGSFTIADGVLRNEDLRLEARQFSVTGRGQVGLGQRNLDYRIVPAAVRGEETLRVPLMMTGPWDSPRFRLDLEALAREQTRLERERLEEIAREEAQRLEERARDQVERRLQQDLGVERQEGERIEDTLRRGLEAEIGNRLRGLLGGN